MKKASELIDVPSKRQRKEPLSGCDWAIPFVERLFHFALIRTSSLCKRFRELAAHLITEYLFDRLYWTATRRYWNFQKLSGLLFCLEQRGSLTKDDIHNKIVPAIQKCKIDGDHNVNLYPVLSAHTREKLPGSEFVSLWICVGRRMSRPVACIEWPDVQHMIYDAIYTGMPDEIIAKLLLDPICLTYKNSQIFIERYSGDTPCGRLVEDLFFRQCPAVIVDAVVTVGHIRGSTLGAWNSCALQFHPILPPRSYMETLQKAGILDLSAVIGRRLWYKTPYWDDNLQSLVERPIFETKIGENFQNQHLLAAIVFLRVPQSLHEGHPWLKEAALNSVILAMIPSDVEKYGHWIIERINPDSSCLREIVSCIMDMDDPVSLLTACSKLEAFPSVVRDLEIHEFERFKMFKFASVLKELKIEFNPNMTELDTDENSAWLEASRSMRSLLDFAARGIIDKHV